MDKEILDCVAFVLYKDHSGNFQYVGTAFFVGEYVKEIDRTFTYIVTAKHVVVGIKKAKNDGSLYLRINTKDGNVVYAPSKLEAWEFHTDPYVDAAVFYGTPVNHNEYYKVVPLVTFATNEIIQKNKIGIGDTVYITGLFVNHFGKKINSPILRAGNIAMMPTEPVQAKLGDEKVPMEAYLVECRSIGGLSGSPVFVRLDHLKERIVTIPSVEHYNLLGIAQGHWDQSIYKEEDLPISDINEVLTKEAVNKGVSIVTPISKVLDIIQQDNIKSQRIKAEKEYREKLK